MSVPVKDAFRKATQTIISILTPFYILVVVVEFHESVAYLRDHLLTAILLLLSILILFIWNIREYIIISFHGKKGVLIIFKSIFTYIRNSKNKYISSTGILLSSIGILITVLLVIVINNTDAYYAIIASEPNESMAINRITYLNEFIKHHKITRLRARAYPSGENNPWYMITINRGHLSKDAAIHTLSSAKIQMGELIPEDSYVYHVKHISIWQRMKALFYP